MHEISICWTRLILLSTVWMVILCSTAAAFGVSCPVASAHAPAEAEAAFLKGEYDKAVPLYEAQLKLQPDDPVAVAGLAQVLLKQQKVAEAAAIVDKGLVAQPKSSVLLTAKAGVLYRQGTPWLAASVVEDAVKQDPCNARLHWMRARLARLNSLYASARSETLVAHQLDPYDVNIRREWIQTLPLEERIKELEGYLATPNGDDEEERRHARIYLESLKKHAAEPHKACRLVSNTQSTEIPFVSLMRDANHVRAFGLEVKLNDHKSRLEIDTGAGGLVVSRSVAEHAGLKPFVDTEVGGVGSEGEKKAYTAYADTIQIGSLEFHDCTVEVLDSRNVVGDLDGLIGMNVLAGFLVTLDYPMRKLVLGPLPPRPTDSGPQTPALRTGDNPDADQADAPAASGATASQPKQPESKPPAAATSKGPQNRYIAPEMQDYTKVYLVGHTLIAPTALNNPGNPPKLFILDTGAFSTIISPEAAREITKLHSNDRMTVHGVSGKVEKVYSADNVAFYFGGLAQPAREVASFDISKVSKDTGLEISGFIGASTLGQVTMHIDYRDGLVKFDYDPNRGYKPLLAGH